MQRTPHFNFRRRQWLAGLAGLGLLAVGSRLWGARGGSPRAAWPLGAAPRRVPKALAAESKGTGLLPPDANGIRLLPGFSSRIVAQAGAAPISAGAYLWHPAPDGGAIFAQADGGWIYVSNSEVDGTGGAGALRFDAAGSVTNAYSILSGTRLNCAGGATPWGTWLSCEEVSRGQVWECDPRGLQAAVARPALGWFQHEAAAVDPLGRRLYLTEDRIDGRLYRFTPSNWPDLGAGLLECAEVVGNNPALTRPVRWHPVPNPNPSATETSTRYQVAASTAFSGGEGIAYHEGIVYFSCKGDNRIWALDCAAQTLDLVYDDAMFRTPILTGVDNIAVARDGTVCVAEDGGDMQLVGIGQDGTVSAMLQIMGQDTSEITGPAFSPDGTRLYLSSQRGPSIGGNYGLTYEISGPFLSDPVFACDFELAQTLV